jgi:hypothetical protein
MEQSKLPWESDPVDEAIRSAEAKLESEQTQARSRALQLAREQAYHRLAVAIDRPSGDTRIPGQLSLFEREARLFDDAS